MGSFTPKKPLSHKSHEASSLSLPTLYAWARERGYCPSLCDAPLMGTHLSDRAALGLRPLHCLEVRDGILWQNQKAIGKALDIFDILESVQQHGTSNFFPAYIGFFSYEFARYLDLPTKAPLGDFPDAFFYYYDEGLYWEDEQLFPETSIILPSLSSLPEYAAPTLPAIACNFDEASFISAVHIIKEQILNGDVYQVNLSKQHSFDASACDPLSLYLQLRHSNPSPFMGLLEHPRFSLVSGSPERLFRYHNGLVSTRPIAGTRKRGQSPEEDALLTLELLSNKKERAEHTMLVDLLRNDLSKIAEKGSVSLSEGFSVEYYSHVMHLVSEVQGKSKASLGDVFKAIFPGGTITGAPKENVMRSISSLEQTPRGAYTGAFGYVSRGHGSDFNILIRSLFLHGKKAYFSAGAGIVTDSVAKAEFQESAQKSKSIERIFGMAAQGEAPKSPLISPFDSPIQTRNDLSKKVLFIENHDSFSHNIVELLSQCGADVSLIDHGFAPFGTEPCHLVLGPGPSSPPLSGYLMQWLAHGISQGWPILGICLGHQAIGLHFGATLKRATKAIHGESHPIFHHGQGLFVGMDENPSAFVRYHSLALSNVKDPLLIDALSEDKTVMAIRHKNLPIFGLQFHPESFLSIKGHHLLTKFLETQ